MAIAAVIVAYLIGSISFAVVVSRAMRLPDPRSYGSKNPGATNVLRTGKKAAALLTLLGDGAKGWIAVFIAEHLETAWPSAYLMSAVAVAVVIGHMFPVFHRFVGGKGVATALGAMLGLSCWLALGAVATWLIIAAFLRISSLAALVAAVFSPAFCFLLFGAHPYTFAVAGVALLLIWRHKSNIRNLIAGTEGRIGAKKPDTGAGIQEPEETERTR